MTARTKSLRKHLLKLVDELGVELDEHSPWAPGWGGGCCAIIRDDDGTTSGIIGLSHPVRTTVDYFVALHEVGHMHDRKTKTGKLKFRDRPILTDEVRAWQWALDNSIVKPTKAVWRSMLDGMTTYVEGYPDKAVSGYGNDRRVRQDPKFYALLERARKESQ